MCVFDLFVIVVGKLLFEGECFENACFGKDQKIVDSRDEKSELCSYSGFYLEFYFFDVNESVEYYDGVGELFFGSGFDVYSLEDFKFFNRKFFVLVIFDSSVKVFSG